MRGVVCREQGRQRNAFSTDTATRGRDRERGRDQKRRETNAKELESGRRHEEGARRFGEVCFCVPHLAETKGEIEREGERESLAKEKRERMSCRRVAPPRIWRNAAQAERVEMMV